MWEECRYHRGGIAERGRCCLSIQSIEAHTHTICAQLVPISPYNAHASTCVDLAHACIYVCRPRPLEAPIMPNWSTQTPALLPAPPM